jgi:hypothetical protein
MANGRSKDEVIYDMVGALADSVLALEWLMIDYVYSIPEGQKKKEALEKLDRVSEGTKGYVGLMEEWQRAT